MKTICKFDELRALVANFARKNNFRLNLVTNFAYEMRNDYPLDNQSFCNCIGLALQDAANFPDITEP